MSSLLFSARVSLGGSRKCVVHLANCNEQNKGRRERQLDHCCIFPRVSSRALETLPPLQNV